MAESDIKVSSVSLTQETYEIAKSMPNFSSFVRECLMRWRYEAQADKSRHIHPAFIGTNPNNTESVFEICYPHSKNGVCLLCWPHGVPNNDDWKEFRSSWDFNYRIQRNNTGFDIAWIQDKAYHNNTRQAFQMTPFEFNRYQQSVDQRGKKKPRWWFWSFWQ